MIELDINFYISSIEDGMIACLKDVAGNYAGDIRPYGGEFEDLRNLKDALSELSPSFPLYLVGYGNGIDKEETLLFPEPGSPWAVRHACNFVVIVASDDARGEHEQRRGVGGIYQMFADTRRALSHRQLYAQVEEESVIPLWGEALIGAVDPVLLNAGEFIPQENQFIAHFENMTAYVIPMQTYFWYQTPDRRADLQSIDNIIFSIDRTNNPQGIGGVPGVNLNLR